MVTISHWRQTGAGTLGSPLLDKYDGERAPADATHSDLQDALHSNDEGVRVAAAREYLRRSESWYDPGADGPKYALARSRDILKAEAAKVTP